LSISILFTNCRQARWVQIGRALIRLTFHCEPCSKILKLVEFDRILHRRGVFGMFLNHGTISIGDRFSVTEQKFEEIPVSDRIRWFLKKGDPSAAAMDLVHAIGVICQSDAEPFEKVLLVTQSLNSRSANDRGSWPPSFYRLPQTTIGRLPAGFSVTRRSGHTGASCTLKLLMIMASMIVASCNANIDPIHVRGPAPQGR
jgi:hypothetical protein